MRPRDDIIKACHPHGVFGAAIQAATAGHALPQGRKPVLESANKRRPLHTDVLQHSHRSTGSHCASQLRERTIRVRYGAHGEPNDRSVEGCMPEGQRLGVCCDEKDAGIRRTGALPRARQHRHVGIGCYYDGRSVVMRKGKARSRANCEYTTASARGHRPAVAAQTPVFPRRHEQIVEAREAPHLGVTV